MVPNNEDSNSQSSVGTQSASKKNTSTPAVEKDTNEYKKLRERNNEAVKKSRTRTKMKTQATLEKVEKLRSENSKLETKIDALKKELDLLKELFMSHAGTKSMKRLTGEDLETLLSEAGNSSKKKRLSKGRTREQIENEVKALLGDEFAAETTAPSSSDAIEPAPGPSGTQQSDAVAGPSAQQATYTVIETGADPSCALQLESGEQIILENFIPEDGTEQTLWTESGEAVLVTINNDMQAAVASVDVQHNFQTIMDGDILMLQ